MHTVYCKPVGTVRIDWYGHGVPSGQCSGTSPSLTCPSSGSNRFRSRKSPRESKSRSMNSRVPTCAKTASTRHVEALATISAVLGNTMRWWSCHVYVCVCGCKHTHLEALATISAVLGNTTKRYKSLVRNHDLHQQGNVYTRGESQQWSPRVWILWFVHISPPEQSVPVRATPDSVSLRPFLPAPTDSACRVRSTTGPTPNRPRARPCMTHTHRDTHTHTHTHTHTMADAWPG